MRKITTEEFQKRIAEAKEKNKEILQKNATCAMQGEYRCSEGGDKWIRFEGVDQGDEHFWAFDKTGINDEDYHPFSHNIEFIVGQKYKYNIWGSVGEDRWEFGHQCFVWEIKENGREAEICESIGLDMELLDVRFNDGYGKWLTIAIDEVPGLMHAVPGGTCPDGGTTPPPDPGPGPDPDPDPEPEPTPEPPPPPPPTVDPIPPGANGGKGNCEPSGPIDPDMVCETGTILTTGYTDPTFFTHAFDPGMVRSVVVINPHDPNGRFLRITFDPHVCDVDEIAASLCLCTSQDANGDPIVEFGETTVTKVDDYTIDVVIKGKIIETHGYVG